MSSEKTPFTDRTARDRIVDAATKLFSTVPVAMTTINAIAKEAGVKQPLLMYHFKTKDRLYHEVLIKAVDELDLRLRSYFDEFQRRKTFQPEEARNLLSEIIRTMIDGMHPDRKSGIAWFRIILFEVSFPSEFFQELYELFLSRLYVMVTGLIMSINDRYDYEAAVLQWMQISSLIVGHQVEREVVKRFTGFKGETPRELEKLKNLIVRNAFLLLETET